MSTSQPFEKLPPAKAFISYAREDDKLREELGIKLRILQYQDLIEPWHDGSIEPGSRWKDQITKQLETADLILLLVSDDFLASGFVNEVEMAIALERATSGRAVIVPIILRECMWKLTPLGMLQALPPNGVPVTSPHWGSRDNAFRIIAEELAHLIIAHTARTVGDTGTVVNIGPQEWGGSPYPGLLTFGFKGAPFFSGAKVRRMTLSPVWRIRIAGSLPSLVLQAPADRR
jgi:hypothetical protein